MKKNKVLLQHTCTCMRLRLLLSDNILPTNQLSPICSPETNRDQWCRGFMLTLMFFIQNKTIIYIFLLQKINNKKIIPDKQFHQVLKKVQTDLAMHLYWYCTDLGSARTSWRWLEFHDKHQWDFVFSLSYKN